jgi:tryptophanyl-tRNA synthetase
MARDMASSFNHLYGEHLVLPEAVIEESVALLPGLDGRKMSKSYDNTIPLFSSREQLKKLIAGIVTDSSGPGVAKQTEGSALFQIYQAFANAEETAAMRSAYADGIAWGDAKQMLFERIDQDIAPMREQYQALIADPAKIEAILQAGAVKATALSAPFMGELRHAVGLRKLALPSTAANKPKTAKVNLPSFKQYRESDGQFYFKFLDADGKLLLQSLGFATPKEAALAMSTLQKQGLPGLEGQLASVSKSDLLKISEALKQLATTLKADPLN